MLTNRHSFRIEWGTCDPSGIVFNPHYFVWFDRSIHALLDSVGLQFRQLTERWGIDGIPLVETRAKFLEPLRYDDEVTIETQVIKLHRCAIDIQHRLFNRAGLAAEGFETRMWTVLDAATGKIRAETLPAEVVALLSRE